MSVFNTARLDAARSFSTGKFTDAATTLADHVEFHIYEEAKHIKGKAGVLRFCEGIAAYFNTVDTRFEERGTVCDDSHVVIYGYATFRRDGRLLSSVHSCDVYSFDTNGKIEKIQSYCNSQRAAHTQQ
ncbi:nuclear transport factor 2 family protein [Pedobacter sp. SYP-B3415]|uniref:nuclear transport factor 2 family protein n=1 Tax=Pedobacter sp. SYP-B3415 TaxID=2496641 RepID=UPI00101D3DE1|nr:nuclear transport factor 2 family protein [Pedobacter sp. SYP-B3415]